jgi:hypothetical protein
MTRSRKDRRGDDADDLLVPRRRRTSGVGRTLVVLFIIGLVLLITIPLTGIGGLLLWRYMAAGPRAPSVALPGAARPRDRILGQWEAALVERPGTKMLLDLRGDGSSMITADTGRGVILDATTWEVVSESGNHVHVRFHHAGAAAAMPGGEPFEWDIEALTDDQIRVTPLNPPAPARAYQRRH